MTGDVVHLEVPRAEVGEGPVWDVASQSLVWVDITGRAVHRYWPQDRRTESHRTPSAVGAAALTGSGGYVLALEDGFWVSDSDIETLRSLGGPADLDSSVRMNDGKVDPQARFWAGTMAYDLRPGAGALYRLDPDGRITEVLANLGISNGLDWSPDGRTFYLIDSADNAVLAFAFDPLSGAIRERRTLVEVPRSDGMPDGMTVDVDGYLWVAMWGGGAVHRFAPDGSLDRIIRLPVTQVTSCTFGGQQLDELYITTAAYRLSSSELAKQPLAGSVFRAAPGMRGRPSVRYAGQPAPLTRWSSGEQSVVSPRAWARRRG